MDQVSGGFILRTEAAEPLLIIKANKTATGFPSPWFKKDQRALFYDMFLNTYFAVYNGFYKV